MRNLMFVFVLLFITPKLFGQDHNIMVTDGDVLIINKNHNMPFDHIDFPRANFIIKRGAIANFKSLNGMAVRVKSSHVNSKGDQMAKLVPLAGGKFFNRFTLVSANLSKAIESNELVRPNLSKESLANN
ncbi:hypothetical protein [Maribacter sp. MAR_2009_72]|uniref:hypothetical protein n=1 Tax=Maribacter sp. MAR_2009_72 TaxID=1250050 RepID=UPI001198D7D0|nr:hypothetical protein [Maribacter sp. MAR_2009_72]TVZ15775.1 hypothetical protein JM81_2027 [Maribacter sp. MAR_2009_72]